MFSSPPNLQKLKANLRLCISRLQLLEKKKTENAIKARKEVADYLQAGKIDRAKIRVEHIVREDYIVEAMELVEMYCDLLVTRFGLIETKKAPDESLVEAIATIIWATPRLQTEVDELKVVLHIFTQKYGKEYVAVHLSNTSDMVSDKVVKKLSVTAPPSQIIEQYLVEIAKSFSIPYQADFNVTSEEALGRLISLDEPHYNNIGFRNPPLSMQPQVPDSGPPPGLDEAMRHSHEKTNSLNAYNDENFCNQAPPPYSPAIGLDPQNDEFAKFNLPDVKAMDEQKTAIDNEKQNGNEDDDFTFLEKRFEELKKRK